MKKVVANFIYYIRRGYGLRAAWQMARVTL